MNMLPSALVPMILVLTGCIDWSTVDYHRIEPVCRQIVASRYGGTDHLEVTIHTFTVERDRTRCRVHMGWQRNGGHLFWVEGTVELGPGDAVAWLELDRSRSLEQIAPRKDTEN